MYILILSLIFLLNKSLQYKQFYTPEVPIDEVMNFIESQLLTEIISRKIKVFTGVDWDYILIPSVSKYLFEDLDIIENYVPIGQINRPGIKYEKHYICVHDTGDHSYGAYQWSEIVRKAKVGNREYAAS